jgi:hypothetical protein
MSDPTPRRTYSQEEVTEILKRAMRQQSLRTEVLSHDELLEMADEVGIDRGAVDAATADLVQTRAGDLARKSEAGELAEERARRFNRFVSSLFTFLIIGVVLYLVDRRSGGASWWQWPIAGFGIALAFQLRGVFFPHEGLERRRRREWKHERRRARWAEREERRLGRTRGSLEPRSPAAVQAGAKEFEAAVQAGVAALLTVAARKLQAHADHAAQESEPRRK